MKQNMQILTCFPKMPRTSDFVFC